MGHIPIGTHCSHGFIIYSILRTSGSDITKQDVKLKLLIPYMTHSLPKFLGVLIENPGQAVGVDHPVQGDHMS